MDEFMTIKQAAEKWAISIRRVNMLCQEGRLQGAKKFGNAWAIPTATQKPADERIKANRK